MTTVDEALHEIVKQELAEALKPLMELICALTEASGLNAESAPGAPFPIFSNRREAPRIDSVWLTVAHAAERAHLHRQTIADALRTGKLHGSQPVRRGAWRVQTECLDAWLGNAPCAHQAGSKRANLGKPIRH